MDMVYITSHLDSFMNNSFGNDSNQIENIDKEEAITSTMNVTTTPTVVVENRPPESTRVPSISATAAAGRHVKPTIPPMKVGMLKKDGHGMISSWKSRHFVLLEGKLTYYEKPLFIPPYGEIEKGSTDLANMQISQIPSISQYRMKLDHVRDKKIKSYVIEANIQKELQDWILAIDDHIEYANNMKK